MVDHAGQLLCPSVPICGVDAAFSQLQGPLVKKATSGHRREVVEEGAYPFGSRPCLLSRTQTCASTVPGQDSLWFWI